ncbi:hypothetical protein KM043_005887 [Ampulex compressa]|nr:hypothetical protein KM043_005887 [Ampulex compressa]
MKLRSFCPLWPSSGLYGSGGKWFLDAFREAARRPRVGAESKPEKAMETRAAMHGDRATKPGAVIKGCTLGIHVLFFRSPASTLGLSHLPASGGGWGAGGWGATKSIWQTSLYQR